MNDATELRGIIPDIDVRIENHGSIFLFQVLTEVALNWFDENVESEPYMWTGNRLAVEHRYAENLTNGLREEGFNCE